MKAFAAFIAVSAAVHLGALIGMPDMGTTEGQGAQGSDILSIAPAAESHAALIEAWETPPDIATTAPQPPVPATPQDTPSFRPETAVQRQPVPSTPQPDPDTAPRIAPAAVTAPSLPDRAISLSPTLTTPSLADTPPQPATAEPAPSRVAPTSLTPPPLDPAEPSPDTRPHFEGSTARAAATSPRPEIRPDDLAPPPAPQPQAQPQAPAPDRIAAGASSGATQGAAPTPAPQATASPAQIQSAMASWGGQIQAQIARARPNVRATGRAVVRLSLTPTGQLAGLGLAQSSGNAEVDQAALNAVQRAGRFPAAPAALTEGSYTFSIPLAFQ